MLPRMIIEQKITAFANQYRIYGVDANGTKTGVIGFAQQKRLAFKERVTFYADESKSVVAFTFRAEKVMDIHGRYFVEDASGQLLGMLKKEFTESLLRSTWQVQNVQGQRVLTVTESNATLAAMRRFAGYIPIVGDIFEIVLLFFKYHFIFIGSDNAVHGMYTKTKLFRDHYSFAADDPLIQAVDWRVLAAMAVALDALQSR